MQNNISTLIAVSLLILTPASSKAMMYTFIKLTCDQNSQSAIVKVFHDLDEAGKARVERHEKDTHYFDDLADRDQTIKCNLGNEQFVSLGAGKSVIHPENNNYGVRLNNHSIGGWHPIYPSSEIFIKLIKPDEFNVRICKANNVHDNDIDINSCEIQNITGQITKN